MDLVGQGRGRAGVSITARTSLVTVAIAPVFATPALPAALLELKALAEPPVIAPLFVGFA
jgi:hypothetical protein